MNQDDQEFEREIRARVWGLASTVPLDVPCKQLAKELVSSMGNREIIDKLALMAVAQVAAFKMISELVDAASVPEDWLPKQPPSSPN